MLIFFFKMILFFVLLGAVSVIFCQRQIREPSSEPARNAPPATSQPIVIVPAPERDGPVEKAGAVADDVLHEFGKVAEKAGQALQRATDDNGVAPRDEKFSAAPAAPGNFEAPKLPDTGARSAGSPDPLAEVEDMLARDRPPAAGSGALGTPTPG